MKKDFTGKLERAARSPSLDYITRPVEEKPVEAPPKAETAHIVPQVAQPKSDSVKRVYTLHDLEPILCVGQRTLYNYIKSGSLRACKIGKGWRVTEDELRRFLSTGTKGI